MPMHEQLKEEQVRGQILDHPLIVGSDAHEIQALSSRLKRMTLEELYIELARINSSDD